MENRWGCCVIACCDDEANADEGAEAMKEKRGLVAAWRGGEA